jgi:hypothetical protein
VEKEAAMIHRSRNLALIALVAACAGCGGGNSPPADANTAEYAQKSNEEMKKMYGVPKADNSRAANASDMMRNMYNRR